MSKELTREDSDGGLAQRCFVNGIRGRAGSR